METSKDLETHIHNAASSLTKSMIGINAGGVILLGSLLNALLAMPNRDGALISAVGLTMYVGILGILCGLASQFRELKLLVVRNGPKNSNEVYRRSTWMLWLTMIFAIGSYIAIGIKLSFFM